MDVFKLAFETTIVGLLALPWLVLLVRIFVPELHLSKARGGTSLSFVSEKLDGMVLTILVIAAVYFLGSAISPLATQFLDDEDLPARLYKISDIRVNACLKYSHDLSKLQPASDSPLYNAAAQLTSKCQPKGYSQDCRKSADNIFLLQEQAVLKRGSDETERVSRLFERDIVLRGAVFNGFAFIVLCCFSYLARERKDKVPFGAARRVAKTNAFKRAFETTMIVRTFILIAISVTLIFKPLSWAVRDYHLQDPSDPPIMETALIILGIIGLFTLLKGVVKRPPLGIMFFGIILTILAYGSWVWTEYLYAKNVIGAFYTP